DSRDQAGYQLSSIRLFLSSVLGADAAAAAQRASGELPVLTALAGGGAAGAMLRQLLVLLQHPDTDVEEAIKFLESAFCAEASWGSDRPWATAAEAAILVLLRKNCSAVAANIAAGLKVVEEEFDRAVAAESKALQRAYCEVARLRSAVAFLLSRFTGFAVEETGSADGLQQAILSLDQSIKGYVEEGFDLGCPNFDRPKQSWSVPYSHWWVYRVHRVSNDFGLCS
ncbi:PETH, partial [Symbiodinium pilosum]